uniref:Uncharacterized protein n=1 Tax=Cacopsylla melanoneura TaxID=428564 RepID=A0A8D8RE76_9HEMI
MDEKDGPLRKRPRQSYLEHNSEWKTLDLTQPGKVVSIGMLKNGNCFILKPINIKKKSVMLKNTCGYDSLSQIICAAACDSDGSRKYCEIWKDQNMEFYRKVMDMISKGVNSNIWNLFGKVLRF